MLSRKIPLKLNGSDVGTTPMLIPSFSSKANIDVCDLLRTMSEFITRGAILISTYDVFHAKNFPQITFPELIFLDSGGYECLQEKNVSKIGFYQPSPLEWDAKKHLKVVEDWPKDISTVVISYDNPDERKSTDLQIKEAIKLFQGKDDVLKEFLIKPETKDRLRIHLKDIVTNIESLNSFDILGITEKELAHSVLDRMVMIVKIRLELEKRGVQIPIHIFGSLDTITTPLYYFSGGDIFDGLSWIRYVFNDGDTLYTTSRAKLLGIEKNINDIYLTNLVLNYHYISSLKEDLEKFEFTEDFNHFENNSEFFKLAYEKLKIKIGEVI